MLVKAVSTSTHRIKVERGYNGTTAAKHQAGAAIGTYLANPGGDTFDIGDLSASGIKTVNVNLHEALLADTKPDAVTIDGINEPSGSPDADQVGINVAPTLGPNVESVTLTVLAPDDDNASPVPAVLRKPAASYTVNAAIPNSGDTVTVNTYAGNDQAQVFSTAGLGSTYLNTGAGGGPGGDNQIVVGDATASAGLDSIEGPLFIDAGNGLHNSLTFTEASALAGDTLTLTNDALIRYSATKSVPLQGDRRRHGSEMRYAFQISYKVTGGAFEPGTGAGETGIELDTTRGMDTVYVPNTLARTKVTIDTEDALTATGDTRDQDQVIFGYDGGNPNDPESASTLDGLLSPVTVVGGGSAGGRPLTSVIVADEAADAPETYTLSASELDRGTARIFFNQDSAAVNTQLLDLMLNAGPLGNTIDVQSTNAATAAAPQTTLGGTTINAGSGNNTILVTDAGSLKGMQGPLVVNGGAGTNALTVDDSADTVAQSYFLGLSTSSTGQVTGGTLDARYQVNGVNEIFVFPVSIAYSALTSVKFAASNLTNAPTSTNTSIMISGTPSSTTTEVDTEGGTNNVTVTNLHLIQGGLTLQAQAGAANSLTVDDSAATTAGTYTVTGGTVQGQGSVPIAYANFAQFSLLPAQSGNDTVDVQSTAAQTSYVIGSNQDSGTNAFVVGDSEETLDEILGAVQFASTVRDTLTVDDHGSTQAEEYDVDNDQVVRTGSAAIGFTDLATLSIDGGSGGNLIRILSALWVPSSTWTPVPATTPCR